jgi:hypothetical protein
MVSRGFGKNPKFCVLQTKVVWFTERKIGNVEKHEKEGKR